MGGASFLDELLSASDMFFGGNAEEGQQTESQTDKLQEILNDLFARLGKTAGSDASTEESATTDDSDATTEETDATTDESDAITEETDATTDESDAITEETDATTDESDAITEETDATTDEPNASPDVQAPGGPMGQPVYDIITLTADIVGLDEDEIMTSLDSGMTLLEIAEEAGMDKEALLDELTIAVAAAIEAATQEGTLTDEQSEQLLSDLATHLERQLEGNPNEMTLPDESIEENQ
ncbi:hypothetical protein RB620_15895 [Paenibacillus sp. LHD-117]|uniref:hypothetical protein n=1 Tax=Paenibacillus sp. LHD-117 TaxID=3071412 RepID=UPI0027DF37C3|nr:hypothetical protein [Paenibacillus sp. LHD-117]MDQ6420910.1 hypothetical protein [Paenibacillus sp. LHD-117]